MTQSPAKSQGRNYILDEPKDWGLVDRDGAEVAGLKGEAMRFTEDYAEALELAYSPAFKAARFPDD